MITVFTNSTGNSAFDINGVLQEGKSYVDLLSKSYKDFNGYTKDGMTVFHLRAELLRYLTGRGNKVIIHLGINEAVTQPAKNFMVLATYHNFAWNLDHYFKTFVYPKMYLASNDIFEGKNTFYRFLEPNEFETIWLDMGLILNGVNIIIMGFSEPNPVCKPYVFEQTIIYNEILKKVCHSKGMTFFDVWNLCSGEVVDGNHLTVNGHLKIFQELVENYL